MQNIEVKNLTYTYSKKTPYEKRRLAKNFDQVLKFDEYQYAYIYYCEIVMKNSDIKENFEYIGNIQNIRNEYEFPVDMSCCGQTYCFFKDFQNKVLWMYNLHNKKQSGVFTKEGNKRHLIYQYGAEKTINEFKISHDFVLMLHKQLQ